MFFFKILRRRDYQQLLDEQNELREQRRHYQQLESQYKILEKQKSNLENKYQKQTTEIAGQLEAVEQKAADYELLQAEYQKLKEGVQERIAEEIEEGVKELGFSRTQIEKLWEDRAELVELYRDRLYSLAKQFSQASREMRKNRGLFLLLVDNRNLVNENFSEFHDGQTEHLIQSQYQGIDDLPQIFSPKINDVFSYMGEKVMLKDENGEITGYEERDGALLIDLRGISVRSRIMVEGVRTYRVYSRVEALTKGSAKHNAAIYASSLNEVMVAIVVSEENSEVTMFRDGRFIKSYSPYGDAETLRENNIAENLPEIGLTSTDVGMVDETTIIEDKETSQGKENLALEDMRWQKEMMTSKDVEVDNDIEDVQILQEHIILDEDEEDELTPTDIDELEEVTIIEDSDSHNDVEDIEVDDDETLAPPTVR
ncbi:hypothetical protein IH992_08985 [Candidatus Poribacteria bacterium]|nr:hypothetical protein [Candidatus Poribacteria bacterium]